MTTPDPIQVPPPDDAELDAAAAPAAPQTGDPRVDGVVARLGDLEGQPPEQHVEAYDAVHTGLQETLADLDRDA